MELVPHAALGPDGQHLRAFVPQRVGMLEAAELAPRGVELAGHPQEVVRQVGAVLGRHREVIVAPAAGRQRLQLEVAEEVEDPGVALRHVPAVVEHGHLGVAHPGGGGGGLVVLQQCVAGVGLAVLFVQRVDPLLRHRRDARVADALGLRDDVEEEAVAVGEERHDLPDLLAQELQVPGVEAGAEEARLDVAAGPAGQPAVGPGLPPLGMRRGGHVVQPGGHVDGHVDVDFLAGVELGAQEVERQVRMALADPGVVVRPAVVADGERGDGVHVPALQCLLPPGLVERLADPGDRFGCVEVQVDLAESEMMHRSSSNLSHAASQSSVNRSKVIRL